MRFRSNAIASEGATSIHDAPASLRGSATPPVATDDVALVRIGSFTGSGDTPAARAESVSFDPRTGRIFVTNAAK